MLIPVIHSTQCVAECAKCGFSGQANMTMVHPRSSVFHRPIQCGRPNYITHEPGFEPGSCVQRLFDTLANHRTHNTQPHCHFDWRMGIGCAMAAEHWVWTNEKPYFSYVEVSALRTDTGKWGNSHAKKFHFGKDRGYCPYHKGACHGCVALNQREDCIANYQ